jgi:type IV pilus assembly protein PilP
MMSRRAFLVLASVLAIGGCADDSMKDLKAYAEEIKARPGGPIKPVPEFKPAETYTYAANDRRTPFQMPEADTEPTRAVAGTGPQPDPNRRREELEQFPLDTLRMVGILEQDNETWGLVQSKEKTIYRVQPDNYVGQNHGKISRITEESIELTELIPDGIGGYVERQAKLDLAGSEGGANR